MSKTLSVEEQIRKIERQINENRKSSLELFREKDRLERSDVTSLVGYGNIHYKGKVYVFTKRNTYIFVRIENFAQNTLGHHHGEMKVCVIDWNPMNGQFVKKTVTHPASRKILPYLKAIYGRYVGILFLASFLLIPKKVETIKEHAKEEQRKLLSNILKQIKDK